MKACVGEKTNNLHKHEFFIFTRNGKILRWRDKDSARAYAYGKSNVADLQLAWKLHIVGPIVNESTKQHLKLSLKGLLETSEFL